jgi:hypothetical protein
MAGDERPAQMSTALPEDLVVLTWPGQPIGMVLADRIVLPRNACELVGSGR